MPTHLPPIGLVSRAEWRESFNDLTYRLHDLLHPSTADAEPPDDKHACLIFSIAREVRLFFLTKMVLRQADVNCFLSC